jgi:hypothetical protein
MNTVLKDRRKVYETLKNVGIDVPRHVYCERDDPDKVNQIEEYDEVRENLPYLTGILFILNLSVLFVALLWLYLTIVRVL